MIRKTLFSAACKPDQVTHNREIASHPLIRVQCPFFILFLLYASAESNAIVYSREPTIVFFVVRQHLLDPPAPLFFGWNQPGNLAL
jgi:hypothetical protein